MSHNNIFLDAVELGKAPNGDILILVNPLGDAGTYKIMSYQDRARRAKAMIQERLRRTLELNLQYMRALLSKPNKITYNPREGNQELPGIYPRSTHRSLYDRLNRMIRKSLSYIYDKVRIIRDNVYEYIYGDFTFHLHQD